MSKFMRILTAVGSMALVVLALAAPSALAAGDTPASPSAAAAWPTCGGGTNTHCVTQGCHGNEVWDYYWNKYPSNLNHIEVNPFLECA